MRLKSLLHAAVAIGVALSTSGCLGLLFDRLDAYDQPYRGPGCRIELYKLPSLQGLVLPVVRDTTELTDDWHDVASVRVVYGTWRLYAERDYKGFMGDYTAPVDVLLLIPRGHLGSLQCLKPAPDPALPGYAGYPR